MIKISPLSLSFLLGAFSLLTFSAFGQEQERYFRYFELAYDQAADVDQIDLKEEMRSHEHMEMYRHCPEQAKWIIAVDAAYPKRIDDISTEITERIAALIGLDQIKNIQSISAKERDNACQ